MCRMHHDQVEAHDDRDKSRGCRDHQGQLVEGESAGDGDLRARENCCEEERSVTRSKPRYTRYRVRGNLLLISSSVELHVKLNPMMATSDLVLPERAFSLQEAPPGLPYLHLPRATQIDGRAQYLFLLST